MSQQRLDLAIHPRVDALDVVRVFGFEQQQHVGPMRGEPLLGEEVRIARRDDAFDREEARVPVIGMDARGRPRVVTEHEIRTRAPDDGGDRARVPASPWSSSPST